MRAASTRTPPAGRVCLLLRMRVVDEAARRRRLIGAEDIIDLPHDPFRKRSGHVPIDLFLFRRLRLATDQSYESSAATTVELDVVRQHDEVVDDDSLEPGQRL